MVQRTLLGLRLERRPSPEHLLGWRIADRGGKWLRIEAASWLLTGHVVILAEDRREDGSDGAQLWFATLVRYERRVAALVWRPVSLIHRRVALAMVRSAVEANTAGSRRARALRAPTIT